MGTSIVIQALQRPVTSILSALLVAIWFLLGQCKIGYPEAGLSYDNTFRDRQFWRIASAQLSHIDLLHLVFNLSALWTIGGIELRPDAGTHYYLRVTCWMLLLTGLIELLLLHVLVVWLQRVQHRATLSVGYSGVLFGWMTLIALNQPGGQYSGLKIGALVLPPLLGPLISLLLTTLLIPRTSFIGHVSGILAGLLLGTGLDHKAGPFSTTTLMSLVLVYFALCIWQGKMPLPCGRAPVIVDLGASMATKVGEARRRPQ